MARPLTRQALTLFAGLALIASVVACGGGGTVPAGSGTGAGSATSPTKTGAKAKADDDSGPAGGATTTTYQNIKPLAMYASGTEIDFLTVPVTLPTLFVPQSDVTASTNEFDVPMTCSAFQTPSPVGGAGARRSADAASATPPPTPQPTGLPVSNCVIVVYANGVPAAVTGFASIDGNDLDFPATSPGLTYAAGTTYAFYVAIATTTVVPPTDNCANKTDNGNHYGNDDTRNQQDDGKHKDCGYHTGEDPNNP